MRALLDVNVLIALLDADHLHHVRARDWLEANIATGWASCPITQNGCIRILSQPNYPNALKPSEVAERLREATEAVYHQFWVESPSLLSTKPGELGIYRGLAPSDRRVPFGARCPSRRSAGDLRSRHCAARGAGG